MNWGPSLAWAIGGIVALSAGILVAELALRIGSLGRPKGKP